MKKLALIAAALMLPYSASAEIVVTGLQDDCDAVAELAGVTFDANQNGHDVLKVTKVYLAAAEKQRALHSDEPRVHQIVDRDISIMKKMISQAYMFPTGVSDKRVKVDFVNMWASKCVGGNLG